MSLTFSRRRSIEDIECLSMPEKHRPKTETARWFQNDGYCYCCDSRSQFVATSDWWRDDYRCTNCNSLPRERALMFCIERFFPHWRKTFQSMSHLQCWAEARVRD